MGRRSRRFPWLSVALRNSHSLIVAATLFACGGSGETGADARGGAWDGGPIDSLVADGAHEDGAGADRNLATGSWDGDPFTLTYARVVWEQVPILCMSNRELSDDTCGLDGKVPRLLLHARFYADEETLEANLAPFNVYLYTINGPNDQEGRLFEDPSSMTIDVYQHGVSAAGSFSITFYAEVLEGVFAVPE